MSRSGWMLSLCAAGALLASAGPADATIMSYSFHAFYYRAHLTDPTAGPPTSVAESPALLSGIPESWQQGTATGVFSFDTNAAPTGETLGPDSPVYADAYRVEFHSSSGLNATATADIVIHPPSVIGTLNGQVLGSHVPDAGWDVVGVPLRWQGLPGVITSTDLHDLPVFTTADFHPWLPPDFAGPVAGDIGMVLNGPNESQAWLFYRIDELTFLGPREVPEPATLAVLATGLIGFGWMRRRRAPGD